MPTADDFRRIALAFPGAGEGSHMGHADYRVRGKIFATLGAPDDAWGMVALMPEQQEDFMAMAPEAFKPAAGAWGRQGSTLVRLEAVSEELLESALAAAWRRRRQGSCKASRHPELVSGSSQRPPGRRTTGS